jgi:STE24 endopeptidase
MGRWHSHHMMVNAAVMGLIAPLRYILLSDALLESMNEQRIEAVFAHEAGHVRHHHMQYFLLFAVCGMLVVSAIVELLVRGSTGAHPVLPLGEAAIQGAGFVAVLVVWGVGFGWISRRFERQADLFGVRAITPLLKACPLPCARHRGPNPRPGSDGLCATAAEVFKSALDRVAVLNGIPHHERSWRHSSIASRIRFLTSLAGDVVRLRAFDRLVHRIKLTLWVASIGGLILGGVYIWQRPVYRSALLYNLVEPFSGGTTDHTLPLERARH